MTTIIDNPAFQVTAGSGAIELIDFLTEVINPSDDCFFMDAAKVTKDVGNNVSELRSTKVGGRTLPQAAPASMPLWIDNALGGRPALRFRSQLVGAPSRLPINDFLAGVAPYKSWTKRLVMKAPAIFPNSFPTGTVWNGGGGTAGHRVELAYSSNDGENILCRAGAALELSVKVLNRPIDTWFLLESAYDHVAGKLALSLNGGPWVLSTASGIPVDGPTCPLGASATAGSNQGSNCDIAYAGISPLALHLSANASAWADNKALLRARFAAAPSFVNNIL